MSALTLVDWLDKAVPARCLGPKEDVIEAHRYAGAREVVENLVAWRDEYLAQIKGTEA